MPPSKGGRKRPRVPAVVDGAAVDDPSTQPRVEHEGFQVGTIPVFERHARHLRAGRSPMATTGLGLWLLAHHQLTSGGFAAEIVLQEQPAAGFR